MLTPCAGAGLVERKKVVAVSRELPEFSDRFIVVTREVVSDLHPIMRHVESAIEKNPLVLIQDRHRIATLPDPWKMCARRLARFG